MMKKLFLLDGNALVYRAHFAFISRPLYNSNGLNTSAITGFVRSLWDILVHQQPSHIAVSFDVTSKTFRNDMYPEYKANRDAQPEDITIAMPYIRRIVEGFNIPIATLEDYEADDVIGTLAKQAEKEGFTVYMVTPDKDFAQLVSKNIYLYKPSRQGNGVDILGVKEILEKWQIERVDQVIDMLGLQGDSVDNIPGIPGIGPKTAAKLLKQFDTVEGIIASSDQLKGKQRENVETFAEQGLLSKKLATINIESPIQFDEERYRLTPLNRPALLEVFKELEFRTLSKTILGSGGEGAQQDLFGESLPASPEAKAQFTDDDISLVDRNLKNTPHTYHLVDSAEAREGLLNQLANSEVYCFDTETTGIDPNQAELVGIAFSVKPGEAYYVPIPRDQKAAQEELNRFRPIWEDSSKTVVGQNIKYDSIMLRWYGIDLKGTFHDTMLAHYLLDPEKKHSLDYLAETFLNYEPMPIEVLIGKKGIKQLSMRDIDNERLTEYAGEDADITLQLENVLFEQLQQENLRELYDKIEAPLIEVLGDIEHSGVNLDVPFLNAYSQELQEEILGQESKIYKAAGGHRFNIGSPKQVGEILFDRLKIPYRWRRTKSGQYSTDEDKMSELARDHEIVANIMRHRMLSKLRSTYVDALPLMVNPRSGRIHSSFNQALAATGRLSSNNPNLQNIPIKTPEGRKIREAFIPRDDKHTFLSADYSQIELRLIAEISKDEAMLEAFQKGQDIHTATAARVYDTPYEDVTADQRRNAKTVNFSITYGAGSTNLSRQLGIKRAEAKQLIEQYFKQYQGLKRYMEETVAFAREHGFVETLLGRRRQLRDINSRNGMARSGSERIAVNTPIQGTAADMIKLAMINIHAQMKAKQLKSKMILQVHDELVFDALIEELPLLEELIETEMKNALPNLSVPIVVGMGHGANWLEAH
ncbi:MAG: DNA polymerase I [Saprospiraceae bacterium]|nr:DNA polymerase I [Saprospiraceae bacterium]